MKIRVAALVLAAFLLPAHAHFMSKVWPQKTLAKSQAGGAQSAKRVLIAGFASRFKDAIAKGVTDSLAADSVYVKMTDVAGLRNEDPARWSCVVFFTTCMAWEMDDHIKAYIDAHSSYRSFVVVITSGNPDSCGPSRKLPPNVDAVASASVTAKIPAKIGETLAAIRKHLR